MRWSFACFALVIAGAAHAEEHVYVRDASGAEWAVTTGPLPEVELGAWAARLFDPARAAAVEPELVWRPAPVALETSHARVAALHLRIAFEVGPELAEVRLLTLRVRYQDALVASVNDTEIARRNVASTVRAHGSEQEAIYVAVTPGLLHEGTNVLALEVRAAPSRLAPSIDVALAGSDLGHIVRGPLVQRLGERSATIAFETDLPMVGEVRWGASEKYDHVAAEARATLRHVIALDDLPPGGVVHYAVAARMAPEAADDASPDYSFHTAPAAGEPIRFVVYGDVRNGHAIHAEILRAALAEAPDFIVSTGDMVQRGNDEADWQRYFAICGDLLARVPVYPVMGNHDADSGRRRLEDVFALPERPAGAPDGAAWYSFDLGGVHFLLLDSNRYDDDRQLAWVVEDLAAAHARGVHAIFAAAQHGPYAHGPHGGDPVAASRYAPLLARAGVTLFFSGHDHIYERGRVGGLGYVVSGGGGAPLYPVRCKRPCKADGADIVVSAHHYVVVEVFRDDVRLCAKRPDGTALEECQRIDLR